MRKKALIQGAWPADDLRRAFVDGAKWWEFQTTGATMWTSDISRAEEEATRRCSVVQQDVRRTPFIVGLLAFFTGFGMCWAIKTLRAKREQRQLRR